MRAAKFGRPPPSETSPAPSVGVRAAPTTAATSIGVEFGWGRRRRSQRDGAADRRRCPLQEPLVDRRRPHRHGCGALSRRRAGAGVDRRRVFTIRPRLESGGAVGFAGFIIKDCETSGRQGFVVIEHQVMRAQGGEAACVSQPAIESRPQAHERIAFAAAVENWKPPRVALQIRARLDLIGQALELIGVSERQARLPPNPSRFADKAVVIAAGRAGERGDQHCGDGGGRAERQGRERSAAGGILAGVRGDRYGERRAEPPWRDCACRPTHPQTAHAPSHAHAQGRPGESLVLKRPKRPSARFMVLARKLENRLPEQGFSPRQNGTG